MQVKCPAGWKSANHEDFVCWGCGWRAGLKIVEKILPKLRREKKLDLVIAQAENVSDGKGTLPEDFQRLKKSGVDVCSGGNWSLKRSEIFPMMSDPVQPIIRPANYEAGTAGKGWVVVDSPKGKVLVASLQGQIVGRDSNKHVEHPLRCIDEILAQRPQDVVATVVNFHGDFSSEKLIIGHYLDGRVSIVVGDHWHIPTADADVLPKGTAHMTDVGMCGSLDSSLGVAFDAVIPRWKDGRVTRNILETAGRMQFNALLVDIDETTGLARTTEHIRQIL